SPRTANYRKAHYIIFGIKAIAAVVEDRDTVIRVGDIDPFVHVHFFASLPALNDTVRNLRRHLCGCHADGETGLDEGRALVPVGCHGNIDAWHASDETDVLDEF